MPSGVCQSSCSGVYQCADAAAATWDSTSASVGGWHGALAVQRDIGETADHRCSGRHGYAPNRVSRSDRASTALIFTVRNSSGRCSGSALRHRLFRAGQVDVRHPGAARRLDDAGRLGAVTGVGAADYRDARRPRGSNGRGDAVGVDRSGVDRLDAARRQQVRGERGPDVVLGQRAQRQQQRLRARTGAGQKDIRAIAQRFEPRGVALQIPGGSLGSQRISLRQSRFAEVRILVDTGDRGAPMRDVVGAPGGYFADLVGDVSRRLRRIRRAPR